MLHLPPLDGLRYIEAAARHQSFVRAAKEFDVTAAAVAHRVRMLEKHLDTPLFSRRHRSGRAYLEDVQRVLAEIHTASERHRLRPRARRMRIVSVEAVAEKWLMLRLPAFTATHPDIAVELETNHRGVDPERRDFDAWLAYTGETAARRPSTRQTFTAGPCSTISAGTPTGRTGSPARASPRPTSPRPRVFASTACWFAPRSAASGPPSGARC